MMEERLKKSDSFRKTRMVRVLEFLDDGLLAEQVLSVVTVQ
jgi:hypothetical protein